MNRRERRRREKARRHEQSVPPKPTGGEVPAWIYEALDRAEARTPKGQLPAASIQPPEPTSERDLLMVVRTADFVRHVEARVEPAKPRGLRRLFGAKLGGQ